MMNKVEKWLYGLFWTVIAGGATSASSWLGMAGAKAVGIDVPVLNLKAVGVIFASGAAVNLFSYLKQSPLPPINSGDTQQFVKVPVPTSDKPPVNPT